MKQYDLVAETENSTVAAAYQTEYRREVGYQSEADLEKIFIGQLQAQAYEYLGIKTEADLIWNLRLQLEKLNITA
jgi:type I restriction enzyme R subunit